MKILRCIIAIPRRIWRYFFPVSFTPENWAPEVQEFLNNQLLSKQLDRKYDDEVKKGLTINFPNND